MDSLSEVTPSLKTQAYSNSAALNPFPAHQYSRNIDSCRCECEIPVSAYVWGSFYSTRILFFLFSRHSSACKLLWSLISLSSEIDRLELPLNVNHGNEGWYSSATRSQEIWLVLAAVGDNKNDQTRFVASLRFLPTHFGSVCQWSRARSLTSTIVMLA